MRFAVMGTGGAGGYFGARLAEAGHDVSFIARGDHLAAMRSGGLRVDSVNGDVVVKPVTATADPREVGVVDYVLLGVKAWQVAAAARAIKPMIGPRTAVLPLQNGVRGPIISFVAGPGHIKHTGAAPTLEIGELDGAASTRVQALQAALMAAKGVSAVIPDDIHVAMWTKFLFIASTSGVGAVTRSPMGIFRSTPETRKMLLHAMQEIERVSRAKSIILARDVVDSAMAYVDNLPPTGTTSMQRDIAEARPSELESLSGAVTRLGIAAGVATPTHAFMYHALLLQERRARGQT